MSRRFGWFLTWWDTVVLVALDSTILFYLPFGIDAVVIYQAARDDRLFWIYPLLAPAGRLYVCCGRDGRDGCFGLAARYGAEP